jgi:hypothetical protein
MGQNVLKASIELRSLVRHGRTEMYFEIPTFNTKDVECKTPHSNLTTKPSYYEELSMH